METLATFRKAARLSLAKAQRALAAIEPSAPQTRSGLNHIEKRGTDSAPIINALARVYNVDAKTLSAVACRQRQETRERERSKASQKSRRVSGKNGS